MHRDQLPALSIGNQFLTEIGTQAVFLEILANFVISDFEQRFCSQHSVRLTDAVRAFHPQRARVFAGQHNVDFFEQIDERLVRIE